MVVQLRVLKCDIVRPMTLSCGPEKTSELPCRKLQLSFAASRRISPRFSLPEPMSPLGPLYAAMMLLSDGSHYGIARDACASDAVLTTQRGT